MSDSLSTQLGQSLDAFRGVFANPSMRRVQLAFAGSILGTYAYSIGIAVFAYEHGGVTAVGSSHSSGSASPRRWRRSPPRSRIAFAVSM